LTSGHVDPLEVGVVRVSPWDLLLLDNEGSLQSGIEHLSETHENAHESKGNEHV